ncbi:helix-turn-helix domain-containing protein [Pseudomonas sp. CCM 7891]|uniref:Helix-turn-helix domain-containing protein n=1 Tax=Pseudomonas karstica TaxID=1055468 RepID=A0A7X2RM84_9PSED|nr:helix-turn-helix transcriptional regulator [Pseudomonas karstica]MTD17536.1 helix-turn-helix domain-containing protein [Pseudomonas karstica]
MTSNEAIGLAIRQTRTQRNFSQEEIGASQSFVSDVERGKKSVTMNRLDLFASCLGVQPATLIIRAALLSTPNLNLDDLLEKIKSEIDN